MVPASFGGVLYSWLIWRWKVLPVLQGGPDRFGHDDHLFAPGLLAEIAVIRAGWNCEKLIHNGRTMVALSRFYDDDTAIWPGCTQGNLPQPGLTAVMNGYWEMRGHG